MATIEVSDRVYRLFQIVQTAEGNMGYGDTNILLLFMIRAYMENVYANDKRLSKALAEAIESYQIDRDDTFGKVLNGKD
jgi:hypothetical protein